MLKNEFDRLLLYTAFWATVALVGAVVFGLGSFLLYLFQLRLISEVLMWLGIGSFAVFLYFAYWLWRLR